MSPAFSGGIAQGPRNGGGPLPDTGIWIEFHGADQDSGFRHGQLSTGALPFILAGYVSGFKAVLQKFIPAHSARLCCFLLAFAR